MKSFEKRIERKNTEERKERKEKNTLRGEGSLYLGVDASAHTSKKGNSRAAESIARHTTHQRGRILRMKEHLKEKKSAIKTQKTASGESKAYNGTSSKRRIESFHVTTFLSTNRRPNIGKNGYFHTNVSTGNRGKCAQDKGQRSETAFERASRAKGDSEEDNGSESNDEIGTNSIF